MWELLAEITDPFTIEEFVVDTTLTFLAAVELSLNELLLAAAVRFWLDVFFWIGTPFPCCFNRCAFEIVELLVVFKVVVKLLVAAPVMFESNVKSAPFVLSSGEEITLFSAGSSIGPLNVSLSWYGKPFTDTFHITINEVAAKSQKTRPIFMMK